MPVSLREAKQLCTANEYELVQLSMNRDASALTPARARQKVTLARKTRDKYRSLADRQRREARGKQDARKSRPSRGNDRTVVKAQLFDETLARFERLLERVETLAPKREPAKKKTDRSAASKKTSSTVRKKASTRISKKSARREERTAAKREVAAKKAAVTTKSTIGEKKEAKTVKSSKKAKTTGKSKSSKQAQDSRTSRPTPAPAQTPGSGVPPIPPSPVEMPSPVGAAAPPQDHSGPPKPPNQPSGASTEHSATPATRAKALPTTALGSTTMPASAEASKGLTPLDLTLRDRSAQTRFPRIQSQMANTQRTKVHGHISAQTRRNQARRDSKGG